MISPEEVAAWFALIGTIYQEVRHWFFPKKKKKRKKGGEKHEASEKNGG